MAAEPTMPSFQASASYRVDLPPVASSSGLHSETGSNGWLSAILNGLSLASSMAGKRSSGSSTSNAANAYTPIIIDASVKAPVTLKVSGSAGYQGITSAYKQAISNLQNPVTAFSIPRLVSQMNPYLTDRPISHGFRGLVGIQQDIGLKSLPAISVRNPGIQASSVQFPNSKLKTTMALGMDPQSYWDTPSKIQPLAVIANEPTFTRAVIPIQDEARFEQSENLFPKTKTSSVKFDNQAVLPAKDAYNLVQSGLYDSHVKNKKMSQYYTWADAMISGTIKPVNRTTIPQYVYQNAQQLAIQLDGLSQRMGKKILVESWIRVQPKSSYHRDGLAVDLKGTPQELQNTIYKAARSHSGIYGIGKSQPTNDFPVLHLDRGFSKDPTKNHYKAGYQSIFRDNGNKGDNGKDFHWEQLLK